MHACSTAAHNGAGAITPALSAGIDYLEIKELNDLVSEYRDRIRGLVAGYRTYRATAHSHWAVPRKVYSSYEALYIQRQLADLWQIYRVIVADCHEMTALYFQQQGIKPAKAS